MKSIVSEVKGLYRHSSVRSIGIYTFTNFFGKAASFLLLFIFTNPLYITASGNGMLSLFSNSILFMMPFLSLGIIHSTSADFFKLSKNEFRDFFTTGFVFPFIIMILGAIVLFVFSDQLQSQFGFPPFLLWLIPLVTFLTFLNEQLLSLARNNNEPGTYLKANMIKIVLELGISVVLVVFFAWHWQGRVAGILIAYTAIGLYGLYYFISRGFVFGRIRTKYLRSELLYAFPIIVMQASIFCMSSSDRFFLSSFTNDQNETVGIYSIANTFATVVIIFSSALLQYVFPKIYSTLVLEQPDYGMIKKYLSGYILVIIICTVAMILFTPILYSLFINEKYHAALGYNFMMILGYCFWAIAFFFYSFLLYSKDWKRILLLSSLCIIISLTLNYVFIGEWGAWGGALASACTYSIVLLLTLVITRPYWKNLFGKKAGEHFAH